MVERPEDLNLPTAVINRIIKDTLPEGVSVSKEARSAIAKSASVFVLYTTSTAVGLAQKNKKKTISAQDVLAAMKEMEFEGFVEPLNESLEVFKKSQQSKKEAKKARKAEEGEKANATEELEDKDENKENGGENKENGGEVTISDSANDL